MPPARQQNAPAKLTSRQKLWLKMIGIIVLLLFFGGIVYTDLPSSIPGSGWFNKFTPKLGLDLQGGAHLVFEADVSQVPAGEEVNAVEGVRDVIEKRINFFGVSEPLIQTNKKGDSYRVIIEMAGIFDVNEAIKQIGETPLLEFKEQNPNANEVPELTEEQQQQLNDYNEQAKTKAQEIITELNSGGDFTTLAKEFSEDSSNKENSGDLGWQKKGTFVPEFDKAIFDDLANNQITPEPVESMFGYHVIQKIEERGLGEDREVHSRHILIAKLSPQDFVTPEDAWLNTELTGKELDRAQLSFDRNSNIPQVTLFFNSEGKDMFAEITKRNLQKPVAIFLDGEAISIPTVQSEITQGEAVITGDFTVAEAKDLAQKLNAGALPVPITLISQQNVGPTLGQISLEKSLMAGLIGLLAVVLFMLLYYRLPGLIAVVALCVYAVIVFGLFELIPVTMTLAGIAGFILSLGIAVDANILIFERLKEELIHNQPLDKAIENGFTRAWAAIRDSNISSLITTVILFWFGTSVIKGFALTLGIGILISMFTAIVVTKTLLLIVVKPGIEKYSWLLGYKKK